MGFIGKVFKGIAKVGGTILKGVAKFAKSPIGQLLMQVGLNAIMPGVGGLVGKAITGIGGKLLGSLATSAVGKLATSAATKFATDAIGGFANKFLNKATDFVSKAGAGSVQGFVQNAGNTQNLASMAKDIEKARTTKMDATTEQVANANLQELFAKQAGAMFAAA